MKFILNIPNTLSVIRLATMPIIVFLILMIKYWGYAIPLAIIIFVVGGILDKLDGYFARRLNQVTDFGIIWDPIIDKLWIHSIMIAMLSASMINFYLVWFALLRDILINDIRALHVSSVTFNGSDKAGKLKFRMLLFYVLTCFFLQIIPSYYTNVILNFKILNILFMILSFYYIIASGVYYFKKYKLFY